VREGLREREDEVSARVAAGGEREAEVGVGVEDQGCHGFEKLRGPTCFYYDLCWVHKEARF